jgi:hypothetical protein
MFVDLQSKYDWVLESVVYPSVDRRIEVLEQKTVESAEAKFDQLLAQRTDPSFRKSIFVNLFDERSEFRSLSPGTRSSSKSLSRCLS